MLPVPVDLLTVDLGPAEVDLGLAGLPRYRENFILQTVKIQGIHLKRLKTCFYADNSPKTHCKFPTFVNSVM